MCTIYMKCVLEKDTKRKPDKKVKVTKVDKEPPLKKKKSGTSYTNAKINKALLAEG